MASEFELVAKQNRLINEIDFQSQKNILEFDQYFFLIWLPIHILMSFSCTRGQFG